MILPTEMQIFDLLYAMAAGEGREQALFGDSFTAAREAYAKTIIENSESEIYIEFPLKGKPGFDFLTTYSKIPPEARFANGGGYGYQGMTDLFAALPEGHGCACGLELDISAGETKQAGVYFQFHKKTELVQVFLESVGRQDRLKAYLDVLGRCPQDMLPAYIGLFPAREGAPIRIGGYISPKATTAIGEDPTLLKKHFKSIGFSSFNGEMLNFCSELLRLVPLADFQFDIWPDGSIGDTFGLSLSFNDIKPRVAVACMETGRGAQVMRLLCEKGLADDRYKRIAGASRAVAFSAEDGNGETFPLALIIRLNFAKVKFRAGAPCSAKFYYRASARRIGR